MPAFSFTDANTRTEVGDQGTILCTTTGSVTWVEEKKSVEIPQEYKLFQNYPNPFNPTTTIRYSLPSSAKVKLSLYDLLGREIETLVNEEQSAGWKEVEWNAANVASGISTKGARQPSVGLGYASVVYFYKLQALQKDGQRLDLSSGRACNFVETKKLMFLK